MDWLFFIGVISLLFGLFLIWGDWFIKLKEYLEEPVGTVEDKLLSVKNIVGLILFVIGAWLIYEAVAVPVLWSFYVLGGLFLVFSLLYLFFPEGIKKISKIFDVIVLPVDGFVLGIKKIIGILFIIAAGYLFYSVYLLSTIK